MLNAVVVLGLVMCVAACESTSPQPSGDVGAPPTIVARWIADDGSAVVLNVSVFLATDRRRLPELARRYRAAHRDARVIVTFFDDAAGPERFVIGHVATDGRPNLVSPRPASVLATFDFPAPDPAASPAANPSEDPTVATTP